MQNRHPPYHEYPPVQPRQHLPIMPPPPPNSHDGHHYGRILLVVFFVLAGCALVAFSFMRGSGAIDPENFEETAISFGDGSDETEIWPENPEDWKGAINYTGLDHRLNALMQDPNMAGLAVVMVENGRISFVKGYGVADKNTQQPVTKDTLFRWASVSKGVAATMVWELAAEKQLDPYQPISSFQTSLALPQNAENTLNLVDVMAQHIGLVKNASDDQLEDGTDSKYLRSQLYTVNMMCAPGSCYSYQNVAYDVLSEAIERKTARPYGQLVTEKLFQPLKMESAGFGMEHIKSQIGWAKPHNRGKVEEINDNYYRVPAAAGVNSNIIDMGRWMMAQMGENPEVISLSLLSNLHEPRTKTPRLFSRSMAKALTDTSYAQGWRRFTYQGHPLIGHSGAVNGYRATMVFDPAQKSGLAMLWNANNGRPFRFQMEFLDALYGNAPQDWMDIEGLEELNAKRAGANEEEQAEQ